jgi:hypothetical protein
MGFDALLRLGGVTSKAERRKYNVSARNRTPAIWSAECYFTESSASVDSYVAYPFSFNRQIYYSFFSLICLLKGGVSQLSFQPNLK